MDDTQFLLEMLQRVAAEPSAVTVTSSEDERGHLFRVKASKVDMGTIIGKEGKNLYGISRVMKLVGAKQGKKYALIVNEPE